MSNESNKTIGEMTQKEFGQYMAKQKLNNKLIWILAFAPLIGGFLEVLMAYATYQYDALVDIAMHQRQFWWVTLILNVSLCYIDVSRLKKAGVDTKAFGKLTFLVPVYLWRRANALQQKKTYFWVWVALFALTLLG